MILRYTRPEMAKIWSDESRFESMLHVEKAVAHAQSQLKIIPKKAAIDIQNKAKVKLSRIYELDEKFKHDTLAFVTATAETVGDNGRFLHFGLTSSDVLDTALSLQIVKAQSVLDKSIIKFIKSLQRQAKKHAKLIVAGRTHGIHAEPTTLGLKFAGFLAEFLRHQKRLNNAFEQLKIAKLSGAVGTYSAQSPIVEQKVAKALGLKVETIATQVVPRDRIAELYCAFALTAGGIERLAIELRHLQRTEVGEVLEGFAKGQRGSSAMPHKRNPVSAENLTGLARLIRSYVIPALENMSLWHERDISHSSVERVILPDAFILLDYVFNRAADLVNGLEINIPNIKRNIILSQGHLFSSHVLLALVEKGLSREEAYDIVQEIALGLSSRDSMAQQLKKDARVKQYLTAKEIDSIFRGDRHIKAIHQLLISRKKELGL